MKTFHFMQGEFQIDVFDQAAANGPFVYCLADTSAVDALAAGLADQKIVLAAISRMDWEKDLSPWPAKKAFRAGKDFSGGANAFLRCLEEQILPAVEAQVSFSPRFRLLAGYSLAGLCALYALYRMDSFQRIACVSGSLWYDGFLDFMRGHPMLEIPEKVYFSLGDKEKMTRNPRMAAVEDCVVAAVSDFTEQGIMTVFEKNPGGHFEQPVKRLIRGIRWGLED